MKLELFLSEITQEMIDAGRIGIPVEDGWGGNVWSKECCVLNFKHTPGEEVVLPMHGGILMRAEHDGGLIWSPVTNAVYTVDDEAYRVMRDLDSGFSERQAADRNNVSLDSVRGLLAQVNMTVKR